MSRVIFPAQVSCAHACHDLLSLRERELMAGEDGNLSLVLRGPGDLQLVREKDIGGISMCVVH